MRRPLYTAAVALAATAGALAVAAPAAADSGLVPGRTQDVRVDLDRTGWEREVPELLEVAVSGVGSRENGCLDPERDMGDGCAAEGVDPAADPGELVGQLRATVAPGTVGTGGGCAPLGPRVGLPLVAPSTPAEGEEPVLEYLELTLDEGERWDDVTCLVLGLTFDDLDENNLAQSDTLDLELTVYAESSAPDPVDPEDPDGGGAAGTPGGSGTSGPPGGNGGGTNGGGSGNGGGGNGGGNNGVGVGNGGPSGAGPGGGNGQGTPVRGGGQGTTPGGAGTVIGVSTASVTVDDGGMRSSTVRETQPQTQTEPQAETRTQSRAAGQSLGAAVVWAGGLFLGVLALGWFLFLVVRRRRRAESAA
ncbi:hypothetical protein [Blastococcus sp. SYSU D00813]